MIRGVLRSVFVMLLIGGTASAGGESVSTRTHSSHAARAAKAKSHKAKHKARKARHHNKASHKNHGHGKP